MRLRMPSRAPSLPERASPTAGSSSMSTRCWRSASPSSRRRPGRRRGWAPTARARPRPGGGAHRLRGPAELHPDTFALDELLDELELRSLMRAGLDEARVRAIGAQVLEARGAHAPELKDPVAALTRDQFRAFAKTEVAPIAPEMHRHGPLVPEALLQKMAELGLFGSSIPEAYGGTEMGYLTMVVLTEELSAASLVAGSIITRPEILTRPLLQGGAEEQRQQWLPRRPPA